MLWRRYEKYSLFSRVHIGDASYVTPMATKSAIKALGKSSAGVKLFVKDDAAGCLAHTSSANSCGTS
jgi:hypothetical protein